jgi:ribosome maturation protein SDO1
MVKMDEAVIAKLERLGHKFEILVDADEAMEVKHGKPFTVDSLLAVDRVFKDSKTGDEQSPETILKTFKTNDILLIAKEIIQHGEVQLTTDQRRRMLEKKRLEIINFIARNAINPQTKTPHPPQRIENAMEQIKFHVDAFKSVEEQIEKLVHALKPIIPISLEKLHFVIKIPSMYAGRCSAIIHKFEITKEEWLPDGSLAAEFILPVGMKQDLLNDLNSATKGELVLKIL